MKNRSNFYLINLIKNNGYPLGNLKSFLNLDTGENYGRAASLLEHKSALKNCFAFYPKSIRICYGDYLSSLSIEKILLWYSHLIFINKDQLNDFYKYKCKFETLTLSGKYSDAYELCIEIESRYGISLWLLDAYSLVESLSKCDNLSKKASFDKSTRAFYNAMMQKNQVNEGQHQFSKRIDYTFSKTDPAFSTYIKYKLFSDTPHSKEEKKRHWKDILLWESANSIIDIFLTTTDCISNTKNKLDTKTTGMITKLLSTVDIPVCQIISTEVESLPSNYNDSTFTVLLLSEDFEKLFDNALNLENIANNSFWKLIVASVSNIFLCKSIPNNNLYYEIINLVSEILRNGNEKNLIDDILHLQTLSRLLRHFEYHKSICTFLLFTNNISSGYSFNEQFISPQDYSLFVFLKRSGIKSFAPLFSLLDSIDENTISTIQELKETIPIDSLNYCDKAIVRINAVELINNEKHSIAIPLILRAFILNPFLISTIDITKIINYLELKVNNSEDISLEELCYIFIDDNLAHHRKTCFLNFLDFHGHSEPLDVLGNESYEGEFVEYYLANICEPNILNALYLLFDSSDEAKDYRIKICKKLVDQNSRYSKVLKREIEDLTKYKAMRSRLINVNKSRVSIDTISIKKEAAPAIDYQIEAYNSKLSIQISKGSTISYINFDDQEVYSEMYNSYAKVFCFSPNGLDNSLSTRVRHGLFKNQLIRVFTDNSIIYTEQSPNSFFDSLFDSGKLNIEIKPLLEALYHEIYENIDYFIKHTLKVFVDEPIEGAVFDFSANEDTNIILIIKLISDGVMKTAEAIPILHNLMIERTNQHLSEIREVHIPALEAKLLEKLDEFSKSSAKYSATRSIRQEVERKISKCKSDIQVELAEIKKWFFLSEYEVWENYKFDELLDMCVEITKKLFSEFENVSIEKTIKANYLFDGKTFGYMTDIALIFINNAIMHSGFENNMSDLFLSCSINEDDKYLYFSMTNNFAPHIDYEALSEEIHSINYDYVNKTYLSLNTNQEGGMGLYKVMRMLHNLGINDSFYIDSEEHNVRVEIKLPKEKICYEKHSAD